MRTCGHLPVQPMEVWRRFGDVASQIRTWWGVDCKPAQVARGICYGGRDQGIASQILIHRNAKLWKAWRKHLPPRFGISPGAVDSLDLASTLFESLVCEGAPDNFQHERARRPKRYSGGPSSATGQGRTD